MSYQTVSLSDLQGQLAARYDGSAFWIPAEATLALNGALRQYNLATGFWKQREILETSANQVYYTVSGLLLHALRITWQAYPLVWEAVDHLDKGRPTWESDRTTTGAPVPTRPTKWIPVGLRTFALWPADAVGATQMTVDGVCVTPVLVEAQDTVDLGEEDLDALLAYALVTLTFKGPRDRWRAIAPAGLRTFYQIAARHNPRLFTIPALAEYFDTVPLPTRTRPPVAPPGVAAGEIEARP